MGLTFLDQLKKLTLLTINIKEICDLSASNTLMKLKKGKIDVIYALKMNCGFIHAHKQNTGFLERPFSPLCHKKRNQNKD
jgi:hypothetical protein